MKLSNPGLIFAVGSMIFMGISNFLYKKSTDELGPTNTVFYYYLFSIFIAFVVWLLFREKQNFEKTALVWPLLIAGGLFLSVWLFNLSLETFDVSLASTIRGLFFVVTTLLAVVTAKEHPTTLNIVAICLAVVSVILIGIDKKGP